MVRPRKIKHVGFEPGVTYFKPRAVPLRELEEVELNVDELEALRLSNIEKLSQAEAAGLMKVHQSTFQRTLARAREKVTDALVNGKAIKIHGGVYKMRGRRGLGGPGGYCVCPDCGAKKEHVRGVPCINTKCPDCGRTMVREQ